MKEYVQRYLLERVGLGLVDLRAIMSDVRCALEFGETRGVVADGHEKTRLLERWHRADRALDAVQDFLLEQ